MLICGHKRDIVYSSANTGPIAPMNFITVPTIGYLAFEGHRLMEQFSDVAAPEVDDSDSDCVFWAFS
jgi:hypothetical protein